AALDPQQLAVLRARGDLERDGAFRRRHLDLAAEGRGGKGDWHLHDQVVAAPLVRRRGLDPGDDDQIAVRAAVLPSLALSLETDLRAVLHTRLDLHGERAPAPLTAGAVTLPAGLLAHGAVAATARARLRKGEEALRLGDDPSAVALRADDRSCAGLRARVCAF